MRTLTRTLLLALALAGCGDDSDDTQTPPGNTADAATGEADAASEPADAGDEADAGPTSCIFNSDCPEDQRCDDETDLCEVGERGTGQNGVDTCESGDDCASAVCVEGPEDGGDFYCSDECQDDDDCTGELPRCLNIAFVGRICTRVPPEM